MKKVLLPILFSSSFCYLFLMFWGSEYMLSKELLMGLSVFSLLTVIVVVLANYKKESFVHKYLMVASIVVLGLMFIIYVFFRDYAVVDIK